MLVVADFFAEVTFLVDNAVFLSGGAFRVEDDFFEAAATLCFFAVDSDLVCLADAFPLTAFFAAKDFGLVASIVDFFARGLVFWDDHDVSDCSRK